MANNSKTRTWTEKMQRPSQPEIKLLEGIAAQKMGGNTMVIPTPNIIAAWLQQVPETFLLTTKELRQKIAAQHQVDITCPLTTGIFLNIVAKASVESNNNTPWWRVVKENGQLNDKFPGGAAHQATLLQAEGHQIIQRGKHWFVQLNKQLLVSL